jgi:glycosyltransferase involved in cell wall biosynthesis
MKKLLFVCNDFIGSAMAGPGIRYWEIAHALTNKGSEVVILAKHIESNFSADRLTFLGKTSLRNLVKWVRFTDCVIQPGRPIPILLALLLRKKIVFDQYDPVIFEFMERKAGSVSEIILKKVMLVLWKIRQRIILRAGNAFLVANERQKDFLIGQMAVLGYTKKLDSVTVLPFGLPDTKPVKTRSVLRGEKIKDGDFLLVWGGGIWDWFDPFTLLRALSKIQSKRDDIKVYFPGLMPPSPDSQQMAVVEEFLTKTKNLGLLETSVFVNTEWTPYERRADYLLEADAGISLHKDSLETRFAFRTRILDYLWARLPIIASKGDCWADIIEKQGIGITTAPGDINAVVAAIIRMVDDKAFRERCREHVPVVATEFEWNTLIERLRLNG